MIARLRSEDGFTLVELLMAATLMLLILGATITTFTTFLQTSTRSRAQNAAQDQARNGVDRVARDMRNQATPTQDIPAAIMYAEPDDVGFITVGQEKAAGSLNARNLMRVRYCLEADSRTLWKQTQTWTTATPIAPPPTGQACPGTAGWQTQESLVQDVVNDTRPVFTYDPPAPWGTTADIQTIDTTLFVDVEPAQKPLESRLNTSVRLRNQNRPPTGDFDAKAVGDRHVLLIAGADDPDGHQLHYSWKVDGVAITTCSSAVCDYGPDDLPAATSGTHSFSLEVSDPSDLAAPVVQRSVNVP